MCGGGGRSHDSRILESMLPFDSLEGTSNSGPGFHWEERVAKLEGVHLPRSIKKEGVNLPVGV